MEYSVFFQTATEKIPFPYQRALATASELPDIVHAPTAAGKTAAIILGWLWRKFFGSKQISASTPRRLVYCLPMRVLVDQTFRNATNWLDKVGLANRVGLHMLMGGEDLGDRDLLPEREAIIIGTQDMLLSRALNRGYGMSRYRWPMHFGLLNNDCLWVFDEVQLMGSGLATTTQLAAFRESFGTMAPCKSVWMSATLRSEWFETIDFKQKSTSLRETALSEADKRMDSLRKRLEAPKRLSLCKAPLSEDMTELADAVLKAHQPSSLTLVVMNTVDRAVRLYKALKAVSSRAAFTVREPDSAHYSQTEPASVPELVLIHSRFRPAEREGKVERLTAEVSPAGRIAVTTQVIEAGVDISARTLFTELALWACLVQRFGRCNRYGEHGDAEIFWIDVFGYSQKTGKGRKKKETKTVDREEAAAPYDPDALEAAREQLEKLGDASFIFLEDHLGSLDDETCARLYPYSPVHVIRKKDILELFDTTPDLAGSDIDISRFIRDGEDLDVQVYWRDVGEEGPSEGTSSPQRRELCPVPCQKLRDFIREGKRSAYHWNHLAGQWESVGLQQVYPGRTFLIPADQGGYDPEYGWDSDASGKVSAAIVDVSPRYAEANDSDRQVRAAEWEKISHHTNKVIGTLRDILAELGLDLDKEVLEALVIAARWHDRGKAHCVFREALPQDAEHRGDDWAKAPDIARYTRKGFRHELASALAMLQAKMPDLACYLAAAHHGKIRLSIRSLPLETRPKDGGIRFARGVWDGDELPETDLGGGFIAPHTTLSLEPMELGLDPVGNYSWSERMLRLRDKAEYGPFRLAFLETLLRVADMRASKTESSRLELEGRENARD